MPLSEILHNEERVGTSFVEAHPLPLPTRIAFIGNYLPRQCGIATFTTDLCTAVAAEYGSGCLFAIPVNDPDSSYEYPEQCGWSFPRKTGLLMNGPPSFSTSTETIWSACSMNTAFSEGSPAVTS